MCQPVQKRGVIKTVNKKKVTYRTRSDVKTKRRHPEYGTSKLELRFAKEFLDKLGVEYVYQFKAEEIGRYFDFFLPKEHIFIEVDGSYWHGYGLLHEEKNRIQKHAEWVDKQKDLWAAEHGIPVLRIWEHEINKTPEKVMELLKSRLVFYKDKEEKKNNKKKRH